MSSSQNTIEHLLASFKSTDEKVRIEAALKVAQEQDQFLVEPLILALNDSDPNVREGVALALGRLRDKRVIEPLISCLNDEEGKVRYAAIDALENFDDEENIERIFLAMLNAKIYDGLLFTLDAWLENGLLDKLLKPRLLNPLIELMKNLDSIDDFNSSWFEAPLQIVNGMKKAGLINAQTESWIIKELGSRKCEVHNEELKIGEGKVRYGLIRAIPNDAKLYPYANTWQGGGCFVGPERNFSTWYCPKCREVEAKLS
jgi:hypothetical protein